MGTGYDAGRNLPIKASVGKLISGIVPPYIKNLKEAAKRKGSDIAYISILYTSRYTISIAYNLFQIIQALHVNTDISCVKVWPNKSKQGTRNPQSYNAK